jgi:hypothetical protein
MRITEAQLRQIIREELGYVTGNNSVLPDGITPELFVDYVTKFWGTRFYDYDGRPFHEVDPQKYIEALTWNGEITQEEAEQYVKLAQMCSENQGQKYDNRRIVRFISKKFNIPEDKLHTEETNAMEYSPSVFSFSLINYALNDSRIKDERSISNIKRYFKSLSKETLEKRVDFMNSMIYFTEEKELPKNVIAKLKKLISQDYNGLLQAAELYSLL